ncbi:MAG: hypothetical protein M0P01_02230 [Treponema sp.]|nr:hypothetical protein [Treponema sp.]
MKKILYFKKYFVFVWCLCVLFWSCTTIRLKEKTTEEKTDVLNVIEKKKVSSFSNENVSDDIEKRASQTAEQQFKEKIANIDFLIKASPGQTSKNIAFTTSYVVEVIDASKKPVSDFSVTISYPASRMNDTIVYATKILNTDSDGLITFMPEIPEFSFDDKITFYPTPISSDPSIMQTAYAAGITASYKVITDYLHKPGVIYVFDFNENDNPGTNSQYLLKELINSGVRVGNSPIPTSNYLSQSIESLYRATYKIVGNAYSFMICGSVKYAKKIETEEDGKYVCQLVADIQCIDMKDGSVIYSTQLSETAAAESKYKVADTCRKLLAEKTAHAILYGM